MNAMKASDAHLQILRDALDRAETALMECREMFGAVFDAADDAGRVSVLAKAGVRIAGEAHTAIAEN